MTRVSGGCRRGLRSLPEVAGSNPTPATKKLQVRGLIAGRRSSLLDHPLAVRWRDGSPQGVSVEWVRFAAGLDVFAGWFGVEWLAVSLGGTSGDGKDNLVGSQLTEQRLLEQVFDQDVKMDS